MLIPRFDPRPLDPLAHAPSRNVSPNTCPKRQHVRQFLQERGIDPDDLRALWRFAAERVRRGGGGVLTQRMERSAAKPTSSWSGVAVAQTRVKEAFDGPHPLLAAALVTRGPRPP